MHLQMDTKDLTHVAVGFQGAPHTSPGVYTDAVISRILGGGASFSSGGPGKGLYSRFYQRVRWLGAVPRALLRPLAA